MDQFIFYLKFGINHILDFAAYDHMLFLLVLCATALPSMWKTLLGLVTAFTVGHCLTLILATYKIVVLPGNVVELAIPITIILTGIMNLVTIDRKQKGYVKYLLTLVFGLVHGLGFSNYLRGLLMGEENITVPLLGFNIGIELGQIAILAVILFVYWLIRKIKPFPHKYYTMTLSIIGILVALKLIYSLLNS